MHELHEQLLVGTMVGGLLRREPDAPFPPFPDGRHVSYAGRLLGVDEIEAGDVFWRGQAYDFELISSPIEDDANLEYGWRAETFDPNHCPPEGELWSIRDHPRAVA